MNKEERLDYLDVERKKLWAKIVELEELVANKTSDYEESAKQASEQAAAFKATSEGAANTISEHLADVNTKAAEVDKAYITANEQSLKIKEYGDNAFVNDSTITGMREAVRVKTDAINEKLEKIDTIFNNLPTYEENVKTLESVFTKGNESDSKINVLYETITGKKKEIDELYFKIFGITDTDKNTGVEVHTPGLIDQLESSYTSLRGNLEQTTEQLNNLKISTALDYKQFTEAKDEQIKLKITGLEDEYSAIRKQITDLLPNALTAGLSYAYADKREAEERDTIGYKTSFNNGIKGLIGVSLIPFIVSIYMVWAKTPFDEVILKVPRIVLAILPIYIPFLWVAYSANKKLNLSKRLIEEYSHKESLSKTFEGLATQIKNIGNKDISEDLRIRLLYNILEVNSENPGKLISDYNKSDHPFMDTLDKSVQLTNSFKRLAKIPGARKLAEKLAKQADNILTEQGKKVEDALNTLATTTSENGNGQEKEAEA